MDGFDILDFDTLREMGHVPGLLEPVAATSEGHHLDSIGHRVDRLWAKMDRLVETLAGRLFGGGGFTSALWPDSPNNTRLPFLWARMKRSEGVAFASHLGIFISASHCNICVDLEKDLLDSKGSLEDVDQVVDFYRLELQAALGANVETALRVWTDLENIERAGNFGAVDFSCFMNNCQDRDHPWPKIGYLLDEKEIRDFGNSWVGECEQRLGSLIPVYDAMIRTFKA